MILVSRTMNDILGYSASATESVVSVFTTWGVKLNSILLAITTGLTTSLIPNIVSSYTKGDMNDVNNKFNKAKISEQLAEIRLHKRGPRPEAGRLDFIFNSSDRQDKNIVGFKWTPHFEGKILILDIFSA